MLSLNDTPNAQCSSPLPGCAITNTLQAAQSTNLCTELRPEEPLHRVPTQESAYNVATSATCSAVTRVKPPSSNASTRQSASNVWCVRQLIVLRNDLGMKTRTWFGRRCPCGVLLGPPHKQQPATSTCHRVCRPIMLPPMRTETRR